MINLRKKKFQAVLLILLLLIFIIVLLEIADQLCPRKGCGMEGLNCQALIEKYVESSEKENLLIPLDLSSEQLQAYDLEDIIEQRIKVVAQADIPGINGVACFPYGFIADSLSDQAKKYVAAHEALHIIGYHNETEVNYMAGRREPLGLLMTIFHSVGVNFKDRKITEYPCVFARMWRIFKFYFLDIG